jgi:transcriptional regulator with XRE-family HTH domain
MGRIKRKPPAVDPSRIHVGLALADLRRDAGLAQEDVGRRLRITREGISHYESGKTIPTYGQVRRMLAYFGVDLHDLQDALDHLEGRPLRHRNPFQKRPYLEEALLADAEALFQRWSRRVPVAQKPRLQRAEAEVMETLRGLMKDLALPQGAP